jgi:HAD superfamily hydrolase (TIGR01490 family)
MRKFAFFDLDDTVLRGTSDHYWLDFLHEEGLADAEQLRRDGAHFQDQYRRGQLDMAAFVRFSTRYLQQQEAEALAGIRLSFAQQRLAPKMCPKAIDLMQAERENGASVVLVTATNDFLARAASDLLGPDQCLATRLQRCPKGRITGEIEDIPCFKDGKLHHIQSQMAPSHEEWANASAYSDSINDLPLLSRAGKPHAVNPCRRLRAHAEKENWPIFDFNQRPQRTLA